MANNILTNLYYMQFNFSKKIVFFQSFKIKSINQALLRFLCFKRNHSKRVFGIRIVKNNHVNLPNIVL